MTESFVLIVLLSRNPDIKQVKSLFLAVLQVELRALCMAWKCSITSYSFSPEQVKSYWALVYLLNLLLH